MAQWDGVSTVQNLLVIRKEFRRVSTEMWNTKYPVNVLLCSVEYFGIDNSTADQLYQYRGKALE